MLFESKKLVFEAHDRKTAKKQQALNSILLSHADTPNHATVAGAEKKPAPLMRKASFFGLHSKDNSQEKDEGPSTEESNPKMIGTKPSAKCGVSKSSRKFVVANVKS